ncbi:oxidoreductase [Bacillus sp. FJAT-45066]|uniref:oxidoreductase n=1 Tax=Bacillus sp. FJAT-45066 TaxID=2011010 RepID=UPI000BB7A574|nr:oxidoreductase [Bacillus sp. FJAT-45066]
MMRKALVIGATGLIGKSVTQQLLQHKQYESATVLVRRPLSTSSEKLFQIKVDFDRLTDYGANFEVDDLYICLGTTIKKAGSKEQFEKVDFHYVVNAVKLATSKGVKRIAIVSALGANSRSNVFYNMVKGEMEEAVQQENVESLYIIRPSLLLGERDEFRFGEKAAEKISFLLTPFLKGKLAKYRPVHGEDVALTMIENIIKGEKGVHIIESNLISRSKR